SEATVAGLIQVAGAATVDFTPLLNNDETIANHDIVGFQVDASSLTVHPLGIQIGATGRITEAIGLATTPGNVIVHGGTYAENVDVNRVIRLSGTATINGTLALSAAGATLDPGISAAAGSFTTTGATTFAPNTSFNVAIN